MKKSLLGIALAAASLPLTFAAQTTPPANPPAKDAPAVTAPKTKKHSKKASKKAVKKTTDAAKPAVSK
jgi:hypothetical protein